jgi:hypothetical protein
MYHLSPLAGLVVYLHSYQGLSPLAIVLKPFQGLRSLIFTSQEASGYA